MIDSPLQPQSNDLPPESESVVALAKVTLSIVAQESDEAPPRCRKNLLTILIDAVSSSESETWRDAVQRLKAAGVSSEDIIDLYIPAAARVLGERWCEDRMSFVEVTLGSSRLQSMVRELHIAPMRHVDAPAALIVVPVGTYHTLGAIILSAQLERLGVEVSASIDMAADDLTQMVKAHSYDAFLISTSCAHKVEAIRAIVVLLRENMTKKAPVIVGGGLATSEPDLMNLVGADYLSNSATSAFDICKKASKIQELDTLRESTNLES